MAKIHCLEPEELEHFLLRRRATGRFPNETGLAENLVEILRKADEFVPSQAGSILLDNPTIKLNERHQTSLVFIAVFGTTGDQLIGRSIPADHGIAGHVYQTGRSYYTADVERDRHFYSDIDRLIRHRTESLVAIPIRIEEEVCGVLELINRQGEPDYSARDVTLLEIFASYISVSIQNVLDARHAQEIARRDNLTGLFNDRLLHVALRRAIESSRSHETDLSLLFIDLDRFKTINDTHGHLAGSQVLAEIGELIGRFVGESGAIGARYGGDEFVVVLPNTDIDEGVEVAERIRSAIANRSYCNQPGEINPEPLHLTGLTCSIGVASLAEQVPPDASIEDAKSTLLRVADTAMYRAKDEGRDRVRTPIPETDSGGISRSARGAASSR